MAESNGTFDERVIWQYFAQICRGVYYMHSQRIMHRDLKPANIFVMGNGILKLGDLGLGRSFSTNTLEAYSKVSFFRFSLSLSFYFIIIYKIPSPFSLRL